MSQQTKWLLWGIGGLTVLGTGGYLVYRATRNKNSDGSFQMTPFPGSANVTNIISSNREGTKALPTNVPSSAWRAGFPLQMGSRDAAVTELQNALIGRYGRSILPRYGADGMWGAETQTAMKSQGLPTLISSRRELDALIKNLKAASFNLTGLGQIQRKIMTLSNTPVWDRKKQVIEIPAETVLGRELKSSNGITAFKTIDGNTLFVHTKSVAYV